MFLKLVFEHFVPVLFVGGAAAVLFDDWGLVVISLATGWLIDMDHLVDLGFFLSKKSNSFDLALVKSGSYFKLNKKVILPLHAWEWPVLWFLVWHWQGENGVAVAGAGSWLIHLAQDQFRNGVGPWAYFLIFRAKNKFSLRGFDCQ